MGSRPTPPASNQLGRPLGVTRGDRRARGLFHHLPIAVLSVGVFLIFLGFSPFATGSYSALDMHDDGPLPVALDRGMRMGGGGAGGVGFELPSRFSMSQMTTATGYLALGLLGLTLLIGPVNLLLRKRNPVSSYLRRDLGIWTAVLSVVHVILGFQVHGTGRITEVLDYFVRDGVPLTNGFGLGNWVGLAAVVIVAGLLVISTDGSIREIGAKRWKNLQRLNYALFILVVLHAFFYGALLRMASPFTSLLIFAVLTVLLAQLGGIRLWRRRQSRVKAHSG